MANRTDPTVTTVHGTNPQFLIEKILRQKIYNSLYWKEHCFGLTAETLVDKAVGLKAYGGQYGGMQKPTKFMCLVLKMLQLQPEKEIVVEFIKNEDYKYLRVLGAFYLRLVGKPLDIYQYLEPLYNDYRKLRFRGVAGWALKHMDEFIEELLTSDYCCDVALPHLPKRHLLEDQKLLAPRISALDDEDLDTFEKDNETVDKQSEDEGNTQNGRGGDRCAESQGGGEHGPRSGFREEVDTRGQARHRRDISDSPSSDCRLRRRSLDRWEERKKIRREEDHEGTDEARHRRERGGGESSAGGRRGSYHRRNRSKSRSRSPKRRRRRSFSSSQSRSGSPPRARHLGSSGRSRRRHGRSRSSSGYSSASSAGKGHSASERRRKRSRRVKSNKGLVIKGLKLHKLASASAAPPPSGIPGRSDDGRVLDGDKKSVSEWNEMRSRLGLKPLRE